MATNPTSPLDGSTGSTGSTGPTPTGPTGPLTGMLVVDSASPIPPFEQIRAQLSEQISSGVLVVGTRLPTVRRLADDLGLAVNTVHRAYQELENAGLVQARGRAGTIVIAGSDQTAQRLQAAADAFAEVAQQTGTSTTQALRIIKTALNPTSLAP